MKFALLIFTDIPSQTTTRTPNPTNVQTPNPPTVETPQQSTCPQVRCPEQKISSTPTEAPSTYGSSTGAVYIRWGRTVCPESASLIYKGNNVKHL